jgi:hypothetical protein
LIKLEWVEREKFSSLDCSYKIWDRLRAILQVNLENLERERITKKNRTQVTQRFFPWLGQASNACLLYVVVSNGQGLYPTPLKWSNDLLECHGLPYINNNPLARNLLTLESLAAIHKRMSYNSKHIKRERREHTQGQTQQHNAKKITRSQSLRITGTTQNNSRISLK